LRILIFFAHFIFHADNRIIAKLSRPEIAEPFLSPAPEKIVNQLLKSNQITEEQARWAQSVPMADAICAESDSGGHTDGAVAFVLIPSMIRMKNKMCKKYQYSQDVFLGAAGGIGTPEAAAASFLLGADFIVTGSINQCTVEAGTSDHVKDLLQHMNIQDTTYAPAGDMFEMGAKVQVLRKGVLFPARANKLYDLYRMYQSLDDIDLKTQQQIQDKFFKKGFDDVYDDVKQFFRQRDPDEISKAEQNSKHKMALIFRWFFNYTSSAAQKGEISEKANFQIHTGPALGAFNRWVEGTELENWKNRHVDVIGVKMMDDAALFLNRHYQEMKK
jgi:trans-AT polyketide synthase/acyltransferase/oxidoreductase domain-containing protein